MRRRELIASVGAAVALLPFAATAQHSSGVRIIGILDTTYDDAYREINIGAFEEALSKLGWVDGQTVRIERRVPGSSKDKIDSDADALVSLAPDVLIANSTVLTGALAQRTGQIPIVFMFVGNPIGSGFSDGLARPSRNMTGLTR